ncbi:hemerythrin domain-containing protein [Modestobacter sp. I12A-02628]|uniref:Hemerythrin domain-containing protein n=1 Tax=Goekera deserti TaxID=2497753 RepID=A0A7K3WG71_9ACTN|nr:hemerythrin domain-containing protein [Goekera deserti]MPQ96574.1 hemerythrin domain-containing protein [Goekera deserti]NDI47114.1 hemerythrin domain-containing protein [Goekera deserti]NEL55488.1 hemerythrin domain-containing protein [Goekera deserti]
MNADTVPDQPLLEQSADAVPPFRRSTAAAAVAHQRVVHQLARREFRILVDLAAAAEAGDAVRAGELTMHAELIGGVLQRHHALERDLLWPALLRSVPPRERTRAAAHVGDWTERTAVVGLLLDELVVAAGTWRTTPSEPARAAFTGACARVVEAVVVQTGTEEEALLPLLHAHLSPQDWTRLIRSADDPLTGPERMLVLGLALEDASAGDRARLMASLSPGLRTAWRVHGQRTARSAVERVRGAATPAPAAGGPLPG